MPGSYGQGIVLNTEIQWKIHTGHEIHKTRDPTWEKRKRNPRMMVKRDRRAQSHITHAQKTESLGGGRSESSRKHPATWSSASNELNTGSTGRKLSRFSGKFTENEAQEGQQDVKETKTMNSAWNPNEMDLLKIILSALKGRKNQMYE